MLTVPSVHHFSSLPVVLGFAKSKPPSRHGFPVKFEGPNHRLRKSSHVAMWFFDDMIQINTYIHTNSYIYIYMYREVYIYIYIYQFLNILLHSSLFLWVIIFSQPTPSPVAFKLRCVHRAWYMPRWPVHCFAPSPTVPSWWSWDHLPHWSAAAAQWHLPGASETSVVHGGDHILLGGFGIKHGDLRWLKII